MTTASQELTAALGQLERMLLLTQYLSTQASVEAEGEATSNTYKELKAASDKMLGEFYGARQHVTDALKYEGLATSNDPTTH